MRGRVGVKGEHRLCRLGGDDRDLDRADRHTGLRLEGVEIVAEADDVLRAVRFRNEDAVESRLHHGGEIVEGQARVERIDAHEEGPVARLPIFEKPRDMGARRRLLAGRDGILEVEDQRVGAGRLRLGELAFRIAGNEQKRAKLHWAFLSISATRRQEQTISLRWFSPSCSKVTIPCVGRDFESRKADHCRLRADRVAGEDRLWKGDFLPAEIADRRAERGVLHRKAHDEPEGEDGIDQRLPEFGRLGVFVVDVDRRRIIGQRREQDVVHVGHRAPDLVDESLTDREFLKIFPAQSAASLSAGVRKSRLRRHC